MLPTRHIQTTENSYALIRIGAALLSLALLTFLQPEALPDFSTQALLLGLYTVYAFITFGISLISPPGNRALNLTCLNLDALFIGFAVIDQHTLPLLAASPLLVIYATHLLSRSDHIIFTTTYLAAILIGWSLSEWQQPAIFQLIAILYIATGIFFSFRQTKISTTTAHPEQSEKQSFTSLTRMKRPPQCDANSRANAATSQHTYSVLLSTEINDDSLLQQLSNWGAGFVASEDLIEVLANTLRLIEKEQAPECFILDLRGRDEDPTNLIKLIKGSKKLQPLRYILIADEQSSPELQASWNKQQLDAGYSAVLNTPLDSTLLFNLLHGEKTPPQGEGITSLFDHYLHTKSTLPPLEIFLAESNPIQIKVLKRQLEKSGHKIYTTSSGEQALDAISTHHFDIVLIGLHLDDMEGTEVSRIYRLTHPRASAAPVIILSNNSTPHLQRRCKHAGADGVLSIPAQTSQLLDTLSETMAGNTQRAFFAQPALKESLNEKQNSTRLPLLNQQTLEELEQLGNGLNFVKDLVDSFIGETNELITKMEQAASSRDFDDFRDCAHAIKGSAGSVGASQLQQVAMHIANYPASQYYDDAPTQLKLLHKNLKVAHQALLAHIDKRKEQVSRH